MTETMFFQGTLQEGISAALQQSKSVVCFVADDQAESQRWESEFLADESLKVPLEDQAITLRLQAGSTEAGYLAAIFPLPKTPTVVIIKNGQLKEYIAPEVSKEDFVARARTALSAAADDSAQAPSSGGGVPSQAPDSAQPTGNTSTESSGQATPSSATEQEPSTVQTLLSERAARLEAQRKKEAEEAKLRRKAKAAEGEKPKGSEAQTKHAESLKRRQKEAREERQRILQAIEDDKAARKARQSEKEAERKLAFEAQNQDKQTASPALSSTLPATTRSSEHCSLQVRLFDGSTLRNRFPSGSRLGADVRKWVDENRGDDKHPYTFKVVLTPLPNKNIDITEEESSLQDLGLTPSSTLILVPASKTAVAAYAASRGNPVSRFIAFILALINGFIANIIAFFTTMFSTSGPPRQHPAPEAGREQTAVASGLDEARIKELRTLRERRNEQQFYNGNSTNFEPRKDDVEED